METSHGLGQFQTWFKFIASVSQYLPFENQLSISTAIITIIFPDNFELFFQIKIRPNDGPYILSINLSSRFKINRVGLN